MSRKSQKTAARRATIRAGAAAVAEVRRQIDAEAQTRRRDDSAWVEKIGAPAYSSILAMAAAMECDYDRLVALRDERGDWEPADGGGAGPATWEEAEPDDAAELAQLEEDADGCEDEDAAREHIQDDPLSVEVRSGWTVTGHDMEAEDYCITLSTGGPAVRIRGELDDDREPKSAMLQVQDWWKPWTEYTGASQDTLLTYARVLCYG